MELTNRTGHGKRHLWLFLLGLVSLLTGFILLFDHFWYNGYIEFDSFTNATVGYHISEGKALYREIWGSKPPGIYFLDAVFIYIFGASHGSIWIAQMVSGSVLIALFYLVVNRITQDLNLSWLATLLFMVLFYFSVIYEGGNLTEEYGAVWIMAGWIGVLAWYYNGYNGGLWLGGAAMCMALWFKEPFLFSVTPAGLWLVIHSIRTKDASIALRFIGGAFIPIMAFLLYFISSNTLDNYMAYFYYTSAYADYTGLTLTEKVSNSLGTLSQYFGASVKYWYFLILLTIPGLILARGKERIILIVLTFTFLFELISISLSGYTFQHYYFQIIPSFYLCVFISLHAILHRIPATVSKWKIGAEVLVMVLGLFAAYVQLKDFNKKDKAEPRDMDMAVIHKLEELHTEGATLYAEDPMLSHLYLRTQMTSTAFIPVPVFHFFMVNDRYAYDRKERFIHSIKGNPPDYIVTSRTPGVLRNFDELEQWFPAHYSEIFEEVIPGDTITIWSRKER